MKKFLIVNPFGIGDVLFTTPVVRAIKESEPESLIGYWCNERVKGILENNPCLYKIFALSRGDIKKVYHRSLLRGIRASVSLLNAIKKEKFDILLDFSLDPYYSLKAKSCGIARRIGFDYRNRGAHLTDKIKIEGYNEKHVVEYYLGLLRPLGISPKAQNLELAIPQSSRSKARDMLGSQGVSGNDLAIGIAAGAGASWGRDAGLKHWPELNYARLADKMIGDLGAKIVILGDGSERPIADTIIKNMHNRPIDLTGRTNLEELGGVIESLRILVTNDGGPLHIAAALGRKTLSFFGPVDPNVYGPYPPDEKRHIVLKKTLECSPCYNNFRLSRCERDRECLEKIDVDAAFAAVKKLL